ncbi:MAG: nucleotidyltransferase domain-containing protein [Sphingobacteriales bacterium]|nr:MAG: nucleotidyltransferase domain-containing protein [Sphingobacteriales bacterium]
MRLNNIQIDIIKAQTALIFGAKAKIYLFGSRVDDAKKGGDIDLLISTDNNTQNQRDKINLLIVNLILAMGEQKIDILFDNQQIKSSIIATALKTGIQL